MKFYDSIGPNPHVVRMFAAEKGLDLSVVKVDLMAGENRRGDYLMKKNVSGTTPALELDDGTIVAEITVIAEYLEELHPLPPLIGTTPEQRAETRMWTRRIDLGYVEPMTNGFRATQGRKMFESRVPLVGREGGEELKGIAGAKLLWFDGQLASRDYVCGDRFTLADVLLYCFVAFGETIGQPVPDGAKWLPDWLTRVRARPSAAA